ncbi:MAG: cobalt-precorrin-6A reductase, partial [Rhodobacteraceae bacterium]
GLPILRLERPPWRPTRRDRWVALRDERAARAHVVPGERVFLATGRATLMRFACLNGVYVIARQISDHHAPFPLPRGRFLRGQAPFSVAGEQALLRRLRIDWLILRNAGGPGGWPKLAAARRLGLRVGMIDRPVLPPVPVVRDVAAALARIDAWLA